MYFVNVKVFAAAGEEFLGGIKQGVGAEINIVGKHIEGFVHLSGPFDVLKDESGFTHALLAQDTQNANIPVDGIVLLPKEVHRGEFQQLFELVVKCLHDFCGICPAQI